MNNNCIVKIYFIYTYTPFRFACKEPDPETGLYYFGARYLDPKTSRWMSADPDMGEYFPSAPVDDGARRRNESLPGLGGVFNYVNLHVYHYGGNNPIRYRDPDGRNNIDEIQQQITELQNLFASLQNSDGGFNSPGSGESIESMQDRMMDLYGQYNRAVIAQGDLNIVDYIQNGRLTSGFEAQQNLSGDYRVNAHTGVDGVGGFAKTPFFTQMKNVDSGTANTMTLSIIGTDLNMQIMHGDRDTYIRTGGLYGPGQEIMPSPKNNNTVPHSTNPHFHFQISNGTNFVNPFTLRQSSTAFKFSNDRGRSWSPARTIF